jgi:adenosylmethionine-8-amino-7-oxononanoate aminotransferase
MSAFVRDPRCSTGGGRALWDVHGKHYYDGLSGIFVVAVGHRNRRVN